MELEPPPFEHNTVYKIESALDEGVVEVFSSRTDNGSQAGTWKSYDTKNQKWKADKESDGFRLTAQHAEGLLALDEGKNGDNYNVSVWRFHGGLNQQWNALPSMADPTMYNIENARGKKCLKSQGSGNQLTLADKSDEKNMLWKITKVKD